MRRKPWAGKRKAQSFSCPSGNFQTEILKKEEKLCLIKTQITADADVDAVLTCVRSYYLLAVEDARVVAVIRRLTCVISYCLC